MKAGGKNNSCVTIEWEVFWLSCDAKSANKKLSLSKYIKAQWRRAEDCALSVIVIVIVWLPCVVDKVKCRKLPVVNCTQKGLQRDHTQGWWWHWWATRLYQIFKIAN